MANFRKFVLIRGNHDKQRVWHRIREARKNVEFYQIYILKGLFPGGQRIVLCHYPIMSWEGMVYGNFHLYGHCHGKLKHPSPGAIDVGYDATGKVILSLSDVKDLLTKRFLDGNMIR